MWFGVAESRIDVGYVLRSTLGVPASGGLVMIPSPILSFKRRTVSLTTGSEQGMAKVFIFVVLSAPLAYVSRASLKAPHSHGFYRFFAWEFILALVLLNIEQWFRDPLSIHQLVSWFLLAATFVPGVPGIHLLITQGRPDAQRRDDVPLVGIEKTTRLVTTGVFKYIRHPLYCSLFLLAWGVFFKDPSWVGGGLALSATAFLLTTAKVEEAENVRYFGLAYRAYMQKTKIFIPFLF